MNLAIAQFQILNDDDLSMAKFISDGSKVIAAGNKEKIIEEFVGRVNTQSGDVSIAWMHSPEGWSEPFQTPEFEEFTVVIKGMVQVSTMSEIYEIRAGQCIIIDKNETVQYSTPDEKGAEYISICIPAFSTELVHRQE